MTLIAAPLILTAAALLGTITVLIRRDGGLLPATTVFAALTVGEPAATDETPAPPVNGGERRRLADDWRERITPLDPPELEHRHLMVRPYVSHHHEDTVELVAADYRPLIGRARVRAAFDTDVMPAVRS